MSSYDTHPLVTQFRELATESGARIDVDAEGQLVARTAAGEELFSMNLAESNLDNPASIRVIMMTFGEVVRTASHAPLMDMGQGVAFGTRHDGTVERLGESSSNPDGSVNISFGGDAESPEDEAFDLVADIAADFGWKASRDGDAIQVYEVDADEAFSSFSASRIADHLDRPEIADLIRHTMIRDHPDQVNQADGWLMMHLRRDGQDFYKDAAVVERFSYAGLEFALIAHWEDAQVLHAIGADEVEKFGGMEATRTKIIADRERAEFILQRMEEIPLPGSQVPVIAFVGDNIASILAHPGLQKRLLSQMPWIPESVLSDPDADNGAVAAFAPTTACFGIFPVGRIAEAIVELTDFARGLDIRQEQLGYGTMLRRWPDEPWGIITNTIG